MRLRKIKKVFLFSLLMIMALILLAVVFINLPFAHRFITQRVNNILANAHVPITINSIETIWPNSVEVNGVNLYGSPGDTIIYAENLGAMIAPLALLQKKVLIPSAFLSNSSIRFLRQNADLRSILQKPFQIPEVKSERKKRMKKNHGKSL